MTRGLLWNGNRMFEHVRELARHAHLECPTTILLLDTILRAVAEMTCSNAVEARRIDHLSPRDLVAEFRLPLVTGYRHFDQMRISVDSPPDASPFTALIAFAHSSLKRRRRANSSAQDFGDVRTDVRSLYTGIRRDMQEYATNALRKADRQQSDLEIMYPDKIFEEEGPVADWTRKWVCTGWVTHTGALHMPCSAQTVQGSRVFKTAEAWAWHVPGAKGSALSIVHRWICGRPPIVTAINHSTSLQPTATAMDTVVYMDGAYDQAGEGGTQKGGFGFVAVRGGDGAADAQATEVARGWGQVTTDKASPVFIGACEHTNNTAELTALAEAICWLLDEDDAPERRVLLRPDSEYAASVAMGTVAVRENHDIAAVVRSLYVALLKQRSNRVSWAHVKGHSEHVWNDVVDDLAKRGASCGEYGGGVPGTRWSAARADDDLWQLWRNGTSWATEGEMRVRLTWGEHDIPCLTLAVRQAESNLTWVVPPGTEPSSVSCLRAPEVSEITRVLRTLQTGDAFGTLNIYVDLTGGRPPGSVSNADVAAQHAVVIRRLRHAKTDRLSDWKRHAEAVKGVSAALRQIQSQRPRDALYLAIVKTGRHITCSRAGPVDIHGLREFTRSTAGRAPRLDKQGRPTGKTLGQTAESLMDAVAAATGVDLASVDHVFLDKHWRHSVLGERLWASGHILFQREYAATLDPFHDWGRQVRWAAHARFGSDLDDRQAYPTAGLHMIPVHRDKVEVYIAHKDTIHAALGWKWWGDMVTAAERTERAKGFFNRLENQGTLHGLYKQFNIPENQATDAAYLNVRLPDRTSFRLGEYIRVQEERTISLWNGMPSMAELVTRAGSRERPAATLRSYCNQECEGISRVAKQRWADWHGHTWFSLEHDGLGTGLADGTEVADAEEEATTWASRALGYRQRVNVKPMPAVHAFTPWVWAKRACTPQAVSIPSSGQTTRVTEALVNAHRQRIDLELTCDTLLVSLNHAGLQHKEWQTVSAPGYFASQLWRVGMLVDRAYVAIAPPASLPDCTSRNIITACLRSQSETRALFVQPNRDKRTKAGARHAALAPALPPSPPAASQTHARAPPMATPPLATAPTTAPPPTPAAASPTIAAAP